MSTKFLKWWFAFVVQTIALGIVFYFEGGQYLYENDKTYISFFIVGVWLITSLSIAWTVWKKQETKEMQWFTADSCMTLGMIGTVTGFIIMLGGSLGEIDPSDTQQMKAVIGDMATGMSTALLTTLAGLIASLFLRMQLVLADKDETQIQ
jgi:hypothetical protein